MARMYPSDIEDHEKATEGEKRVFRFIKEAARPHRDFICWYEPLIDSSGKEPDFVLFGRKSGLLVLEVKDWTSQQIVSYNPHRFTVIISGKHSEKTNPDKQARGYVHSLKERLSGIPEFLSNDPRYKGNLKIPIGRMVVFPNISRDEYTASQFKWFMESERTLLKEDLEATGEILFDTSGNRFYNKISKAFPFRFQGMGQKDIEKLSFILWPEGKIDLPIRSGSGKTRFQKEVQTLDESQARLALRIGSGHQIIKGPSGSGKTLVLVYRCCHIRKYMPRTKRILFVCYNIALVSYLRRLLQEKGMGLGQDGIHTLHFFELCSKILGKSIPYENEENEYYEMIIAETLQKIISGLSPIEPFDAIFIDEAQDFSNQMLRIPLELLKQKGDLVIGLDPFQDLYRRQISWKSLGINASGRTYYLKRAYRNTIEIFDFTQRFIGKSSPIKNQTDLFPDEFSIRGDPPEIKQYNSLDDIETFLAEDISSLIDKEEYKKSEIAIIYDDKVYGQDRFTYDNRALPMRILNRMESFGIPTTWVSRDVRTKELYDITTDRVSLISIHSAKGLDFDLVYLVGMDRIRSTGRTEERIISLVYVAMTRSKFRLVIPYMEETGIITRMKDCLPA